MTTTDGLDRAALGRAIQACRVAAGMTQHFTAIAVGLTASGVARIEQGNAAPSLAVFMRLADLYRVTLDRLAGRDPAAEIGPEKSQKKSRKIR